MKKRIVIDTDAGTDDAQAIAMALSNPGVEILAITTVSGNCHSRQAALNILRLLKLFDRLDIPVHLGAARPLLPDDSAFGDSAGAFHGTDGFGDCPDADAPSATCISTESAFNALIRIGKQSHGDVSLVCLGPLTNVALCIRIDPDFVSFFSECYVMAQGNVSMAAECNFFSDPESAHVALTELCCPITIVTWELSLDASLPWGWYVRSRARETKTARFFRQIESVARRYYETNESDKYTTCDEIAMAALLDNDVIAESVWVPVDVELRGGHTRGQMVVDWTRETPATSTTVSTTDSGQPMPVRLVTRLNSQLYVDMLWNTLS